MTIDPWTGPEQCGFCLQRYAFELEVSCGVCDRPMCPFCVVRHRFEAERRCPACADELARGAETS